MNKLNKFAVIILGAVILTFGIFSCSNDEVAMNNQNQNSLTKSGSIDYNYNFSQVLPNGKLIKTEIDSSIPLDGSMTEKELENSIVSNHANISVRYYIDDIVIVPIVVQDGVIPFGIKYPNNGLCSTCHRDGDGNITDSIDCSSEGINQCAFSTYQQWSTAKIIAASLSGVAQAVLGDCMSRNCFGW